jgi:hypothetical protein
VAEPRVARAVDRVHAAPADLALEREAADRPRRVGRLSSGAVDS